jgi:hypothetical protein
MSHKTERRGPRSPTRKSNPSAATAICGKGSKVKLNQEEFFLKHQVDGQLTDEQMGEMMNLPEGDTGTPTPESGEPDAAAAPAAAPAPDAATNAAATTAQAPAATDLPNGEQPAVIMAKDGVHTIPYEKLTEARETAREATARAESLAQELGRLKATPAPAPAAAPASTPGPAETPQGDVGVFGDFSEEAISSGIKKLVDANTASARTELEARFATALAPIQKQQVDSATELHFKTIETAHPDAEAIAESAEMKQWIERQPAFVRDTYAGVLKEGTAAEVVELMTAFKEATGKTTQAAPAAKADPAAAAKAAIAKADSAPPTSLSEIPAGSAAHHDEAAAMLDMTSAGLMSKFEGKTPEQIRALMDKVI